MISNLLIEEKENCNHPKLYIKYNDLSNDINDGIDSFETCIFCKNKFYPFKTRSYKYKKCSNMMK